MVDALIASNLEIFADQKKHILHRLFTTNIHKEPLEHTPKYPTYLQKWRMNPLFKRWFFGSVVCCRGGFFFWSFWCSKCWKTSPWQEANSIPYSRPYSLTGHNITAPPPPPPPPPIQHMASRWDGKQRCRWWSAHCHLWPKCGTTPPVLAKVLLKVTGATLHPTNIHVKRYCEHKLIVTLGWCFSHKSHKSHKSLNFVVQ